jgi:hypothetical protein
VNVATDGLRSETTHSYLYNNSCPVSGANAFYNSKRLGAIVIKLPDRFVMGNLDVVKIEKLFLE